MDEKIKNQIKSEANAVAEVVVGKVSELGSDVRASIEKRNFKDEIQSGYKKLLCFLKVRFANIFEACTSRKSFIALVAIFFLGANSPYLVAGLAGLTMILNTFEKSSYINHDAKKMELEAAKLSGDETNALLAIHDLGKKS